MSKEIIEIRSDLCDKNPRHNYKNCIIQTIDFCSTSYNDFFENFMMNNFPCIIKNISREWQCTKYWIKNNTINYDYFYTNYGDIEAPVADCDNIDYNAHSKCNMKVGEYIDYLKEDNRNQTLYLKDWHLRRLRPNDKFYDVPHIFGSDWLNEYAVDHQDDDFMFVYVGPSKSWTPFHADVYSSYSWSVNIFGRKKWIMLPPGEEVKLKDSLGNLPVLFIPEKFPSVKYFEIIQDKGDALFVPSGWHHQVTNLFDTISINHNFINACNIDFVWNSLQKNLLSVEKEIQEYKETPEFQEQCQLILKSVFGMNFVDFLHFISHIGHKRLNQSKSENHLGFYYICLGFNHIMFDLKVLVKIITSIQNHPLFLSKFLPINEIDTIINLKNSILEIVSE